MTKVVLLFSSPPGEKNVATNDTGKESGMLVAQTSRG